MLPKHKVKHSIENRIFLIRGHRVILDCDLAAIYGVTTKRLNEQVKRNRSRFPEDFMFRLSTPDAEIIKQQARGSLQIVPAIRSQIATASKRNIRYLPYVFTEYGALMAANILNSDKAVAMSVYVIRAFIRIREALTAGYLLEKRLAVIEKTLLVHNAELRDLFQKIKPLLLPPPEKPKRQIGFHP